MPADITFSIPTQQRQGVFSTGPITYPGGYSKIHWQYNIPNQSEYENTNNSIISTLLVNGEDASSTWGGGPFTDKHGNADPPPQVQFDLSSVPVGATLEVQINVVNQMTVGMNGVITATPL